MWQQFKEEPHTVVIVRCYQILGHLVKLSSCYPNYVAVLIIIDHSITSCLVILHNDARIVPTQIKQIITYKRNPHEICISVRDFSGFLIFPY